MERFVLLIFLFIFSVTQQEEKSERMFFSSSFHPDEAKAITKVLINFCDTISEDTLTIYFSKENFPSAFSRNISTVVCMDSLCRIVDITLYWEISGKYLGYSLPKGEELTKGDEFIRYKHIPFIESDYAKLNEILSDSSSPLGFYTIDKILPAKKTIGHTDAISGATSPNLVRWVIPHAAYTCFTLWHITYGATRDSIVAYTKKNLLSNRLLTNILQNNDPYNQIKALQWISEANITYDPFIEPAINILHKGNFYSSRQALKFLEKCNLNEEFLQKEMIQLLDNKDYRIKNFVIEYISKSQTLSQSVAREMINLLKSDDYYLVNVILTLFAKRYKPDYEDQLNLCILLKSKNVNVANRVYNFLINWSDQSPDIAKKLTMYKKTNLHKD